MLGGSGLAWQDGDVHVHEVRSHDCVIYRANELEHTFVAGPEGLEYLLFGTRHPTEVGWLPRSRAVRLGWPWVEGRDDDPWEVEAAGELLAYGEPTARPVNIVNVDEVEHDHWQGRLTTAPLATRERSELAGLHWERSRPGGAVRCRIATPRKRRCLSFSRAVRRWSCGRRRGVRRRASTSRSLRCSPGIWSRGLPGQGSRTRSSQARRV